jgi:hypothetical protein
MKNLITDIKENWRKTPNSVKFWNGLVLLGLIISGIISLELLSFILAVMSIFTLALFIDGMSDDGKHLDKHIWMWFTPLVWVLVCAGGLVFLGIKLYESTISEFNNWLDNELDKKK